MSQISNVNFRMDSDLKNDMEQVCSDMGLTLTAAFTIFAKTVTREKRIPFEVTADPFYSDSNMRHLRRGMQALNDGKGVEHPLIEEQEQ
ncbi:type II toxin-antitoxin system RelB/DinJ family antitoxin [Turicimonas muris]|uniref:Damage-inducible protein J n=2 Tax=Turicimonas muris TaxID=1796652 RepID=A0A227KQX1_9BURK|nr:type II toxin-antitoxin system RelB/DinJ family antitoxin [Turicimonas muris]ANU66103.1 damage-inducible protein J [Burkholderiales bacterium YL45]OXE49753.1 damage-inducible protein J [Turicimonas muris]QQQ97253.1 type II toxin-antitoxin system RelB/DinJ family antitoxin [Turicimonas muris]